MASCCVRAVMVSATAFMCVTRPLRSVAPTIDHSKPGDHVKQ